METTVEEIMANKDSYDGKEVSVNGAISTPRFKSSRHGKLYMTFPLLGDSKGRINVLFWGEIKLKTGKKVEVKGVYRKIMEMGKYTFRDVIEAGEIKTEMKIEEKNP
jgi:exonuclease VII large subunit